MKRFKEWWIKRILDKINNCCGWLSANGYPIEVYEIRKILHKIRNSF